MKFRTEVSIGPASSQIDYSSKVFMIGSCFTDNIGAKLKQLKFQLSINPFGVLYNPVSIARAFDLIIDYKQLPSDSLVFDQNLWHSLLLHGDFSQTNQQMLLDKANIAIAEAHNFLTKSDFVFVTFGTAWVYRYLETNQIVANCHKIKADRFERFRLDVDFIVDEWQKIITRLKSINKNLKIVFTISPVRHLKDGAHENLLSKSVLALAIDALMKQDCSIDYFPAYELINDDLRDYRFYAPDMVHLSDTAINYVFEKIRNAYFSDNTQLTMKQIAAIVQAAQHRILQNNPIELNSFKKGMLQKIKKIQIEHPFIDLSAEYKYFLEL
ncbi:MAG TPA: GSCFA domain-containing protein [Prolixibacteraceae bacterium]|nr:GSCFA domain-containing protein [Prolixibacteraceae bacterium]HPR60121.1 GSCFA domain-containing protein [Prolixibacteraceae bacterium]